MDFGEVLGRAWRIVWKHKILWIFGIFAGCARGGGGGGGGGGSSRYGVPGNAPSGQNPFPGAQQWFTQFGDWINSHLWVVALFIVFILLLIILAIWLGTMGRIGLIKGTSQADAGAERLAFGELWRQSMPFFWRIFGMSLLVGLAFLVVLLPILALGIGLTVLTFGLGVLCLLPLICILIPVSIALQLVVQQAESAIVIEDLRIMDGLRRGWAVFKQNLGPVLIIWLILVVIALVAGIVIAIPALIVVVPAALVFVGGEARSATNFTPLIIAGLCLVAYLPFLVVLNGILTAYLQSVWTLTFLRLTRPKADSEAPVIPAPNA